VSQEQKKIEKLKIIDKRSWTDQNTHVHKQITQGSITNHRAIYLGAHIHTPLKPVKHRWQVMLYVKQTDNFDFILTVLFLHLTIFFRFPASPWCLSTRPISSLQLYEGLSKSFRTESIKKYAPTFRTTRWEATWKLWQ